MPRKSPAVQPPVSPSQGATPQPSAPPQQASAPQPSATSPAAAASPATPQPAPVAAPAAVAPPPKPGAPMVPLGFVPLDQATSRSLLKPTPTQAAGAASVAEELAGATSYVDDFTTNAPSAELISTSLTTAIAWITEEAYAKAYWQYASAQKQLAWDQALQATDALQPEFTYAEQHDVTVDGRYAQTAHFLQAKKEVAARGVATRKANKKAATTAATPAPAPSATTTTAANAQSPKVA